jgi:N-glycosylase/DNA lyase
MNGKLNGDCFLKTPNHSSRSCTLYGRIVSLRQDSTHLHYRVTWPETVDKTHETRNYPINGKLPHSAPTVDDTEALLRHYLALKVDLESLYQHWSKADLVFRKKAPKFTGVRILSQDSWETLISFICSSNNNISRISQMVRIRQFSPTSCC